MSSLGRCALLLTLCALLLSACHVSGHKGSGPNSVGSAPASQPRGDAGNPRHPVNQSAKLSPATAPATTPAIATAAGERDDPDSNKAGTAPEPAAPSAKRRRDIVPVPQIEPQSLLGLVGPDLEGRLGTPFMVRRESPAEIWQYRGETCVFDIFLYPEATDRRVVYLEARDKAARPVAKQNCLSEILRARTKAATG